MATREAAKPAQQSNRIVLSVLVLTFARLIVNITRRFVYPFVPEISRQLEVPLTSVQSVIAANAGTGLASPLFGPLSERYGRKRVMLAALALMALAAGVGALFPQFSLFAAVMLVLGTGKMIFDPAMQAYIGDRVPYTRRAMAIGTTELSWALSLVIAAPVVGYLLGKTGGLQTVFAALVAALLTAIVALWMFLPPDHPQGNTPAPVMPWDAWRILRKRPAALGAIGFSLMVSMANEIFFINFGTWMELSFELVLATLGIASTVIAAAEVSGEFIIIGAADRFGKRRLALIGALVSALAYVGLPMLTFSLPAALAGLFFLFLFFEITIVASIPLFTEIVPEARGVMMSGNFAAHSLGRMSGAIIGGLVYSITGNFFVIGGVAMLIALVAFAALWRFVGEHEPSPAA